MFSDLNLSTPCDVPCPLDTHPDEDPLAPLNFDDLLDIARDFEFTRTITHIWPCEEPSTCPEIETGLEDILAAIMPTPSAEESPLPLPSSTLSIPPDPIQEVDLHGSVPILPAPDKNENMLPPPKDDDRVRAEAGYPIASILRGWSPPDGSQFLDLDESLTLPQSVTDRWISPWLATFFMQPERSISPSSATAHPISDVPPLASATGPKTPPVSTADKVVDNPRRKTVLPPVGRAVLEPVQTGPALQGNASQTVITPHAKTAKSRVHLRSTPATNGTSAVIYTKAPRGGIPPHIARTVTKANILRIEKERKFMQDAFSSTTMGEGKKPSVLRRAVRTEKECGGRGGKKGDDNEKEGRTAKRARV